ncbi:4-hydroxythreonine-4-phosphate dehydrogenase PdxA [Grimontia sp. SpTr1]|uniref:4-hydroxythreonine-4-phosphate dehydrogenase PdxA n=1 Tax=Grimontia sp. SpTr1 TaxID=2995319 RepID=UPI00248B9DAE|nr:4-hydroxythreonine-4-phosphate dehydrogenase PdxA [Grimontia sp. SpTr1]
MLANEKPIAITMGDPSGIGPEIILKALNSSEPLPSCVVIGDLTVIESALAIYQPQMKLNVVTHPRDARHQQGVVNLLVSSHLHKHPRVGRVQRDSGEVAFKAILKAIELAKNGEVSGVVTAPINKESLSLAKVPYPGHTEIFADYGGADDVAMMLLNESIKTVLVTVHCSLRNAIEQADFNAQCRAIELAHNACIQFGIPAPRIAVAGLNPHAGENGLFGDEEKNIINPAIEYAKRKGINASGPWPGDTVFMQAREGRFDIVVAQYHDQGLIPVKYMGLDEGVNVTLGLPFIRTSPDHGTGFDIAGKGIASPSSLLASIRCAHQLSQNRDTLNQPEESHHEL